MEINDLVICVSANTIKDLTQGKIYRVKEVSAESISIINDAGEKQQYFRFRFKIADFYILIKQLFDFV